MNETPKPCPFCGYPPVINPVINLWYGDSAEDPKFIVECLSPACQVKPKVKSKTRDGAIKWWNFRPLEKADLQCFSPKTCNRR